VAEFLPGFQDRVREALKILLGEEGTARVRMGLAKDGSGVGGMSFFLSFILSLVAFPLLLFHAPSTVPA
jgi:hexokinase